MARRATEVDVSGIFAPSLRGGLLRSAWHTARAVDSNEAPLSEFDRLAEDWRMRLGQAMLLVMENLSDARPSGLTDPEAMRAIMVGGLLAAADVIVKLDDMSEQPISDPQPGE